MSTAPGLRFYHHGQLEGRRARVTVQLGAMADEPADDRIVAFYDRLLQVSGEAAFHAGEWRLLEVAAAGDDTHADLAAWRWQHERALWVVAVNLGARTAQGHVRLNDDLAPAAASFVFDDRLNDRRYPWPRSGLESAGGLYVRLEKGGSHIFHVVTER